MLNRKLRKVAVLALSLFCFYCSTGVKSNGGGINTTNDARMDVLSETEAELRAKQVSQVAYQLQFQLNKDLETFAGSSLVSFNFNPSVGQKLFLDMEGGQLISILINDLPIHDIADQKRFDGHRIYFDSKDLNAGHNKIEITYTHPYSHSGNGLHRFKDPVDQNVYLYTHFEPFFAHQLFPCFDQPDIKATYTLTAVAPSDWEVISNTLESKKTTHGDQTTWNFPASPILSTYLFAMHAGPYASWSSKAGKFPLRLFARQSVKQYIDHDEWFKITQNGLAYFGKEFGVEYPFHKYDQIIVPDFNMGAMENAGAITFTENYIFRGAATADQHRRRANTILHEMAHMWFGDLVTMKWWNGLWLNESFATLMATLAVDEATHFKGSWRAFKIEEKDWALKEDQYVTTHSIELPVPTTDDAEANFDGITYGKGASVLKQLRFYLGADNFRKGLQNYFQKYAYSNTTLSDFMNTLGEAAGKDLTAWQNKWLLTSGVNSVEPVWSCGMDLKSNKSVITHFELVQTAANTPQSPGTDLPHRTQLGFFYSHGHTQSSHLSMTGKTIDVLYQSARTPVQAAIGLPCPLLVVTNYGDQDYAKTIYDPQSLKAASSHLGQIDDPFVRQMLWQSLWEMVVDSKLSAVDYAETALSQLKHEKDTFVLEGVLHSLASPSAIPATIVKYLPEGKRTHYQERFEERSIEHFFDAPEGSDLQQIWFNSLTSTASTNEAINHLSSLLSGAKIVNGFTIDQVRRWSIIKSLARNNINNVEHLIEQELKSDHTDMGHKAALGAIAGIPKAEIKSKWGKALIDHLTVTETDSSSLSLIPSPKLPLAKLREVMRSFHGLGHEDLIAESADLYFDQLPVMAGSDNPNLQEYSRWFATFMYPSLCDQKTVDRTTALIEAHPKLHTTVMRTLKQKRQEEERCIRARSLIKK